MSKRLLGLLAAAAALGAAAGCGERHDEGAALRDWSAPGADLANTRHVGGPIDAASVARLRVAWKVPLRALYAATPMVVDGVAYTQDLQSNVYAIDAASGRVRWTHDYDQSDIGPNGVNVADGRVYAVLPRAAIALDAASGRQLWETSLQQNESELVVMAPGVHDGRVLVSTVPGKGGAISTLWALDAATGRRLWKWEQVPRDLWGDPVVNGGGGLWHPPAFDGRGGLYIAIANPVPFPGVAEAPWGSSRPGPNRWNNAIVKLDERTGRFLWGNQVLPHDIYDWDLECPPILATVGGRRVALSAGKMGFVYAFDAEDGRMLWKRSVGLHNGHDDDNLLAMRGQFSKLRVGAKLLPGGWGGVETQMASDGRTVYVPVNDFPGIYTEMAYKVPAQGDPIEGRGELVAIDVASGRVKWDRRLPHSPYGAAAVVNDLVFTTTYDGTVWALRRDSGAIVWSARLGAGTDAPVAIAGDTLIAAASIPLAAGQRLELVAYRLDG